ncbi:MAG TPA: DNA recombination protein RmuC [Candidatus Pacearchaeota archaeon]|nr:DNA recombination protein RmuC [Candidatus Pacearchaeota archaeon]
MSDIVLIVLGVLVSGVIIGAIFYLRKDINSLKEVQKNDNSLSILKQDIEAMKKKFEEGLFSTQKEIQQSFEKTSESYARMQKELGTLQEIGSQMKGIQEFLQSPKLRGNLGEQVLKDLLEQIVPQNRFNLQYKFQGGDVVDAILKTNQGIIAIDSKFPMENFRKMMQASEKEKEIFERDFKRDIKKHINDISRKYILPDEGTVDFAVMYVPSEAVYYEIVAHQPEILEYGYEKKVYLTSPNTFYYFLKIVMVGLEGAKIEEASKKILATLKSIQQEAIKFGEELRVLSSHIQNAKSAADRVNVKYEKLAGKIESAGELEEGEERKTIEN